MTSAIRVLVVDDDIVVRQVLTRMLGAYPDIEVVGEAATGDEAIVAVEMFQPTVITMDIRMPKMDGIAAARVIKANHPEVIIIGLSEYAHGYHADALEKAGAWRIYHKSKASEELYAAIREATAS
jgi:DNA-binding NarL/FixJ family response regulator